MTFHIQDTMRRKKVPFEPTKPGHVRMYTCGPTVYNYAHIGNYRAYIFEDQLRRYLKFKGFKVEQVMNLTDVDDKTIRDSQSEGLSLKEFTDRFKKAFFEDINTLNIERAESYPSATDHINHMILLVQTLLDKEYAYKGDDGSIYFSIAKFPEYGKLAHIKVDELKAGARVKQDEYDKENAADFALWKAWDKDDGDVFWEAPFGKGRPGWHIECSAMSMSELSGAFSDEGEFTPHNFETMDIHTGGVDNIFPHHEDEIAQSEGATGKQFSKYWMHCEHLLVENKKMSKSLGNFYTLRDLLDKGHKPKAIRWLLLSTHYRQKLNFTIDGLHAAEQSIQRLRDFMQKLGEVVAGGQTTGNDTDVVGLVKKLLLDFEAHMDDDLNISAALANVFDFVRDVNKLIAEDKLSSKDASAVEATMRKLDTILGVLDEEDASADPVVDALIKEREEARTNKDWAASDRIRDELKEKGIILEDTPQGTRWKKEL